MNSIGFLLKYLNAGTPKYQTHTHSVSQNRESQVNLNNIKELLTINLIDFRALSDGRFYDYKLMERY